jgi:hypothetical protein
MRPTRLRYVPEPPYTDGDVGGHFSPSSLAASLLREVLPLSNFGPALPSSRALLFSEAECPSKTFGFGSIKLTIPCARRMADMSAPALLERLVTHIFSLSLRRPTESSSLGPAVSRRGFEPNLLPRLGPTANGVSSSLVRLPHFRWAPSSDGALFFTRIRQSRSSQPSLPLGRAAAKGPGEGRAVATLRSASFFA